MYRDPSDRKRANLSTDVYRIALLRIRHRKHLGDPLAETGKRRMDLSNIRYAYEVARRWIRKYYDASPALVIDQIVDAITTRFPQEDWLNVLEELSDRLIDEALEREKARKRGKE